MKTPLASRLKKWDEYDTSMFVKLHEEDYMECEIANKKKHKCYMNLCGDQTVALGAMT